MSKIEVVYVTGNPLKVDLLKKFLPGKEFKIVAKKIDCPEIQADTMQEVASFSAKWASNHLKADVLKNDSGLVIPALNGFPSAYSKYVEQNLQADGILALMKGKKDRSCYYLDAFAYCEYGKEPQVFVSKTHGTISKKKSGTYGSGFDKIFIPQGHKVTMANMNYDTFLSCFNSEAIENLSAYLKEKALTITTTNSKTKKKTSSKKKTSKK